MKMSAETMSTVTDEEQDLRKQIGCMNGIFQIFDRHHCLTCRRFSGHHHKRLLQGRERQQDAQYMKAFKEKVSEVQERPRISTESSQGSYSSSTCSTSTFSSLDCSKIAQPETLSLKQINVPESPRQNMAITEEQPPLSKSMQSLDLRRIVKDSMYREARGLSIQSRTTYERSSTAMKHIDSPRSSQPFKPGQAKATDNERSTQVFVKVHEGTKNSKEERLSLPRFSYDGRESREATKWGIKHKELPRLSLDSKTSSMKCSPHEARVNFLGRDQHTEIENSSQPLASNHESGNHHRSSSVVAKLMGLETLSHTISSDECRTPTLRSSPKEANLLTSTTEKSRENQVTHSPRVPQSNPTTTSPRLCNANSARKQTTSSRFPMEPAPWRQQDCSQGSPKMTSQTRKATTNTPHLSSSVYSEIEKRVTEIECRKSGKDLRALKQIVDAMGKTRERLENQSGESAEFMLPGRGGLEDNCTAQNFKMSMQKNKELYHKVPTTKSPCTPRQLGSSALTTKPAKVMDKVSLSTSTQVPTKETSQQQRLQTREPKHRREISAYRQKGKDLPTRNNNLKDHSQHLPSPDKKAIWRPSELNRTTAGPQCITVEKCSSPGRSLGMASPRLQQNLRRIEGQSYPTIPLSDSHNYKRQCSKKLMVKSSPDRKRKVKAKELQINDDQISELSSETRNSSYQGDTASVKSESSHSQVSQTETEVTSPATSTNKNARHKEVTNKNARHKEKSMSTKTNRAAIEIAATTLERPSPISVLDNTIYSEDSPSPVQKTSTDFRDGSLSPVEAESDLENPKHSTGCRRPDHGCKFIQKLEKMKHSVHELSLSDAEHDKIAATHKALASGSHNPNHKYISKVLLTSGLLKDSIFISADQLLPSCHLINPDVFHVLEQTEDIIDLNGKATENNDKVKLNKKLQRKIIFDMVDEILIQKISSGRYTVGNKSMSPQGLLKEVFLDMDRLCRISDCNFDNADDTMIRLLTADMMYQSEDWVDYSGEIPALVLDIERQIFKDLINEVVAAEAMGFHDWPKRHCRQLFSR